MSEQRITAAIDRIERALARIESAAKMPRGDSELAARHEALRQRVSGSLEELDVLIKALDT